MRAAAHLLLTPVVFAFGWAILSFAVPQPLRAVGLLAAIAAGAVYGWRNRHR
jgi:hypothetical protein